MITELTPPQMELLATYRKKWIEIGLSTEPLDLDRAIAAARQVYAAANVPFPEVYHVARSPHEATILAAGFTSRTPVQCVEDQIYGCHEAGWLSFYDYVHEVLQIECVKPLQGLIELAKCCGWWAPYDDFIIFQDRPSEIHLDANGRTHHETGPAISYRDGFGVFVWHGVHVPKFVVENPEQISPDAIREEKNAEIRRVMLERYGFKRYLEGSLDVEFVSRDEFGELYKHVLENVTMYFVKVVNGTAEPDGTFKEYILTVPGTPTTALEAVASTYRLPVDEYMKMNVRT